MCSSLVCDTHGQRDLGCACKVGSRRGRRGRRGRRLWRRPRTRKLKKYDRGHPHDVRKLVCLFFSELKVRGGKERVKFFVHETEVKMGQRKSGGAGAALHLPLLSQVFSSPSCPPPPSCFPPGARARDPRGGTDGGGGQPNTATLLTICSATLLCGAEAASGALRLTSGQEQVKLWIRSWS